ncbi:MAG: hypothetical protein J6M42_08565 [Clostridia bacterium]|nr:hypothetical protein [Clostridia bacterium]
MKLSTKPATLRRLGIVNLTIHIPILFVTSAWSLWLVGMLDWPPAHMAFWTVVGIFPFFIPVGTCAVGIILPCLNRLQGKSTRLCFLFSLIGFALYAALFAAVVWVGGRY